MTVPLHGVEGEEPTGTGPGTGAGDGGTHAFALAGVDLMLDRDQNWKLLEFNFNPAAPPVEACSSSFRQHLSALLADTVASARAYKPCGRFTDLSAQAETGAMNK